MLSVSILVFWSSDLAPEPVSAFIASLGSAVEPGSLLELKTSLQPGEAAVLVRFSFEIYPMGRMEQVRQGAERSGGAFLELWKLSKQVRDSLRAEHLKDPRQAASFEEAARLVSDHLAGQPASAVPLARLQLVPGEAPTGDKRRQSERYACTLEVEFRSELDFVLEHASNISNGGLFVRTELRPPPDSLVGVKLTLPNGRRLETTARVAHVRDSPDGGVGLAFTGDDPAFEGLLDQYLRELARAR